MSLNDINLVAVILCGGKSLRMGNDKYAIEYYGMPQWEYLYRLIEKLGLEVFISCNVLQKKQFPSSINTIIDSIDAKGPATGLLSAHQQLPQQPFIVVACDTPLINATTITTLIQERDTSYCATAYKNNENNLPEPLIALWENKGLQLLKEQALQGKFCPRKILIQHSAKLISSNFNMELLNANTEEDYKIVKEYIAHIEKNSIG